MHHKLSEMTVYDLINIGLLFSLVVIPVITFAACVLVKVYRGDK